MPSTASNPKKVEHWRRRLYLPAYRVSDAARYSGTATQTISYWRRQNEGVGPALPRSRKGQGISYLELIEVAFVATFRAAGVPLQRIRKARAYAAQVLKSEHPFAELRWQTEGHHVMLDLRDIDEDALIGNLVAADKDGQVAWPEVVADRFTQFDYYNDLAMTWHVKGRDNLVIIDPRISFGAPTVKGIPTWVLKGRWDAGESIADIEDDFGLSEEEIRQGLVFEGIQEYQLAA